MKAAPSISETNWVAKVSTAEPYDVNALLDIDHPRKRLRVTALDCGEKFGILRGVVGVGIDMHVVPWDTPAEEESSPRTPTASSSPTAQVTRASFRSPRAAPRSSWARFPSSAFASATR